MSTLTELMRDVADHQPEDGFTDPTSLTALGRSRLRRRRTTVGVIAAAVVALVVAPFAIHATAGPEPASPTGKVIQLDQAVPGVAGRDYTTLSSVTSGMLHVGAGHLSTQGELPDGRLVVALVNAKGTAYLRHGGVLDPATGSVAWFPARDVGLYLGRDGDLLVFGTPTAGGGNLTTSPDHPYQVYDLSTGAWRSLPANRTVDLEWGGGRQSQVVSDGMLYVALDTAPTRPLWRVPLDGSSGWKQVGTVGAFGVGAGSLVFTNTVGPGQHTITVRDLATGSTHTVEASFIARRCSADRIGVSTAYLALSVACSAPGNADRLVILTHSGTRLASVDATYLEPTAVTDSVVGFSIPNPPGPGLHKAAASQGYGGYLYHPATGRLVRLSTQAAVMGPFTLPADPLQLWHYGNYPHDRPGRVIFDVVVPR